MVTRMQLVTTEAAAAHLAVTPSALKAWRVRGGGPPWIKVGGRVRYDVADLDSWLKGQRVTGPVRD